MSSPNPTPTDPPQTDSIEKTKTIAINPIDVLLSLPPEHDITGSEIADLVAIVVNRIRSEDPDKWRQVLLQAQPMFALPNPPGEDLSDEPATKKFPALYSEDPQIQLEQTYQDLQNALIQVRQAVAQAIATERQMEQQVVKNYDQATTWANRSRMALEQNNEELSIQALQRQEQYTHAGDELRIQLESQRSTTADLRQKLTDLEGSVQKAYTKKQVLISRDKAAQATILAHKALNALNVAAATDAIDQMEKIVVERESQADALANAEIDLVEVRFDQSELLTRLCGSLERLLHILERLDLPVNKPTEPESPS